MDYSHDPQAQKLIDDAYIPSAVERKKAVLMYFFIGIVMWLSNDTVSEYESFHLRQSIGRRTCFFVGMVLSVWFVFIPYAKVIPFVVFLGFVGVRVLFIKQAYEWVFVVNKDKIVLPVFGGLWWRIIQIFAEDDQ